MPAIHIIANPDAEPMLPPRRHGESDADWTDRIIFERRGSGRRRQCSIGWHLECSDPYGQECTCGCHKKIEQ